MAAGFAAEMVVMGTGTSVGVPVPGCRCDVCLSEHPRNQRTRTGVLVRAPQGEFVIDTGPELRLQLIRSQANQIHAAVMTHGHADHVMGLDDLRIFGFRLNAAIPIYCEENVEEHLRQTFAYAFVDPTQAAHQYAIPQLRFERIAPGTPFSLLGLEVLPLRVKHGQLSILGFRIGDTAFCTDVSTLPAETREQLRGLKTLVLSALRHEPHPTHLHIAEALRIIRQLQPEITYLTHMSHELDYEQLLAELPEGVYPAWDGLQLRINSAC